MVCAPGLRVDTSNSINSPQKALTMFATEFPVTYEPIHTTGLQIVRVPATGLRVVGITDDFGNMVENDTYAALYSINPGFAR